MKTKEVISLIAVAGISGTTFQQVANINNEKSYNNIVLSNDTTNNTSNNTVNNTSNNSIYSSISLDGYWGGNPYLVSKISLNQSTKRLEVENKGNTYFSWYPSSPAYTITLLNKNGGVIKSETYNGSGSSQNVYNNFNGLSFEDGDTIEITSHGLNMSLNNSNGKVENISVNSNSTKMVKYQLTQNGLKKLGNNLTVNPIYFSVGSNKTNVSGKTMPNKLVSIWVDGKDYTTTSNSNGEYNLDIDADEAITQTTSIRVFVEGEESKVLNPVLNPNIYKIQNNSITINNVWNQNIGVLKFNPETSKLEFTKGWAEVNPYLAKNNEAFSISLYKSNGELIKSVQANGGESPEAELNSAFNNLSYSYGDIISINYKASSKISVSNFDNEKNYDINKSIQMKITQGGLKELPNNLTVNPIYFSIGSNKTNVSGKTVPNATVNIWIDGKDYITRSNSNGEYNLNIDADKPITSSTKIEVFVDGEQSQSLNTTINPNVYKIIKNNIALVGNWYGGLYTAANISFNPETMKLNITGKMRNYFSNGQGQAFEISLYSKNGSLIKTETYNNSNQTKNLYDDFNNLGFSYGDIIKVSSLGKGELKVSNYEGQSSYLVNNSAQMVITQDGLVPCKLPQIKVNLFDVLGNGKVTSGILTGTIAEPNKVVNVTVDGKTFSGKSDDKGNFSINISDSNGFINTTNILVETPGEIATVINPTANESLGILNTNITISDKDQDGTFGQTISFDPATMTVKNKGNNFAAQLISGKTGEVLASCSTGNFNVFTSKNNLNGTHFEYGDVIAVYETQETELSMGELLLDNGKSKIDCTNKFKCFEITPNGLTPVANKNLTTSQILYKGTSNMTFTGKTLPNTDVTITYGTISKVVKSNSNGEFSLEIPVSEAPIGSEVRIFVNKDNNEILTVQYDSKLININSNRIEIENNTNVPIFNITFDAVNNKLQAIECALTKTYTGAFYANALDIKLINPKNGNIIYSFTGDKLNNIGNFISNINNKAYNLGDIIEVSYNPKFVKASVYDGKKMIGNTSGAKEYFEVTNKGLININNKFINVKPLDILSSSEVTSTNIEGTAKPNTSVEVSVDGNVFKGMTNGNGDFNIPINDKNGFTSDTNIVVSSGGYVPTTINPTIESNIQLMNSYINFYNNQGWQGELSSSIGFNPQTMKFVVNNYTDSFGNGNSHYFNLDLYNDSGEKLLDASINDGSTSQLTEALNGKSFNYGDIIGLSYNNTISKPIVLNGNQALGNISGNEEYFKITKEGLVPVKFGQNAYTSNVSWNGNNLVIDSNLADGQSEAVLNANKKLVILNSSNQVVDSVNTSTLDNNSSSVQGIIPESSLDRLNKGETYTFALEVNNQLFPIKVESNTPSNSKYVLEANSDNTLSIITATAPIVTINSAKDITSYMNVLTSDINTAMDKNTNIADVSSNSKLSYEITTRAFISRIGAENLENFFNKSEANKEFVNWVLNNETAMQEYLDATSPTKINMNGLQIWSDIWNKYTNSRAGFNLKLAIATAISNATPIHAWPNGAITVGSPVERYNIFETLNAEGGMLPIFRTLNVRHIMYVVNTWIPNSEILEMRAIIMQNHNAFINASGKGLNNIAYTINYNETNPHTGASVFGPDFYGKNPNILDVWYDGGVCGATSKIGSQACQIFGIPAEPVGQPGHCAFIFYNNEHKWTIGNNIFGWSQSEGHDISGWSKGIATNSYTTNYDLLYENINPQILKESNEYLWLANSETSYQSKMNAINEALKIEPLNVRAWLEKIALMKTNHNLTIQDYINLSDQIISALKDYPMPMYDVLLQIKNMILNNGNQEQYDNYVNSIRNALNSVTNSNQKPTAQDILKSMPQQGVEKGATPLVNSEININNVWSQALGTIGFNPINMQMTVNKGNGEVNPYLNGEAFSIGLYNKDNQLIKEVTLNGGESPENALYNAFNNLGFKYGDKIYIDYKASSKISVSHLYKDGVLDNSYTVNKPGVFEITPKGLVYIGDSIGDSSESATVNVSTVYDNGKPVTAAGFNYKETGEVGSSIKNDTIPKLENYHIDYVTVNGIKVPANKVPTEYLGNNINIVYHMAKNEMYKLNVDVKTDGGQVLNTMPEASYSADDKISIEDNNWNKEEYKLDYILVDGVKTPADKLPTVMPDKNLNITYVVSPIAKTTITVEAMADGKVLGKPVVTTNYEGEGYKEVAPVWNKIDYKLDHITVNGVKTSEADLPKEFGKKDITIIYNLVPNIMSVGERVVNEKGKVLYENEYKLPFNTSVTNIEDKIPSNYKLKDITVSSSNSEGHELNLSVNTKTYTNIKDVKVLSDGEIVTYNVVPIEGEISYETQIGNEKPVSVGTESGQIETEAGKYNVKIPEGYEVKSITVNGQDVSSLSKLTYEKEKQVVVYHLEKIPTGSITESIVTNKGNVLMPVKVVKTGEDGEVVDIKGLSIPTGYKLEKVTIGGEEVKEASDYKVKIGDKSTAIVYTVTPIEKNTISEEMRSATGKIIVPSKVVAKGIAGEKVDLERLSIPTNYHLVEVLLNNKPISTEVNNKVIYTLPSEISNKNEEITYVVAENKTKYTVKVLCGKQVIENETTEGNIGSKASNAEPNIPKGYVISSITVNGHSFTEKNIPKIYGNKNIEVVYNVTKVSIEKNTISEEMRSTTGQVIVPSKVVAKGIDGEKVELKNLSIPTDYHLVKVLLNNKPISTEVNNKIVYTLPSEISNKNEVITYIVAENKTKYTVKVLCGKQIIENKTTEGDVGRKVSNVEPNIPKGYVISSITVNGHSFTEKNVPKTYGNKNIEVIYNVTKVPTGEILEKVITNTGKVIVKEHEVASGEVGTAVNLQEYKAEKGYSVKSIIINGKTYSGENIEKELPKDIEKGETLIIYVVEENSNTTQSKDKTKPSESDKAKSDSSSKVNHNTGNSGSEQENHSGKADNTKTSGTKVTHNTGNSGSEQENHSGKADNTGTSGTKVNHNTGNSGSEQENHSGKADNTGTSGTKVNHNTGNSGSEQENHSGKADNTGTSGTKVNHNTGNSGSEQENHNENTPQTIHKSVEKGEVIIKVIDQNGKIIEEANHTGDVGFEFNPITIPSKDKIVSVTLNGQEVSTNTVINKIEANKETDNKTTVIYKVDVPQSTVKKENTKPVATGKVIVKVVNQDGKIIESAVHEGTIGSEFNPISIPKNDKIVSVMVNGVETNEVPNSIEENSNNNTTTIIYNVNVPEQQVTNKNSGDTNKPSDNNKENHNSSTKVNHNTGNGGSEQEGNSGKVDNIGTNGTKENPSGKNNTTNAPNTSKNNEVKNGDLKVEVVNENGKVIYYSNVNEKVGSKIEKVNIPTGYHLDNVSVTINGESSNELPSKVVEGNTTIIYHVSKDNNDNNNKQKTPKITNGTLKVEVVSSTGKVIYESTSNEPVGSKINELKTPKGYKLQSITSDVNGNELNGMPTSIVKGETVIVYHVEPINNEVPEHNVISNNHNSGSETNHSTGNSGSEQENHNGKTDNTKNSGSKVSNNTGNSGNEQENHNEKTNNTKNGGSEVNHNTGNSGSEQGNHNEKTDNTKNGGSEVNHNTGNSGSEQGNHNEKTDNTKNGGAEVNHNTGNSGSEQENHNGKTNNTKNSGSKVSNNTGNSGNEQENHNGKTDNTKNGGSEVNHNTGNSGNEQGNHNGKTDNTKNGGSEVNHNTENSGSEQGNHNGKTDNTKNGDSKVNNESGNSSNGQGNSISNIGSIGNNSNISTGLGNNNQGISNGSNIDNIGNIGQVKNNEPIPTNSENNKAFNSGSVSDGLNNNNSYTDNNLLNGQGNQGSENSSISGTLPNTGLNVNNKENEAKDLGALAALVGAMSALFIFRRKK